MKTSFKRVLSLALALVITLSCFAFYEPANANAASVKNIYTVAQLKAVSKNLSGSYRLMRNLDLSSVSNWTPIGTDSDPFTGTFNGNGHTIKNLRCIRSTNNIGLFGVVTDGAIKNLTITGKVKGKENTYTGAFVGHLTGGSIVYNCVNKATVIGVNQVGGLVGRVSGGCMLNCQNEGKVTATGRCCGGITSDLYPSGTIFNCNNLATITGGTDLTGGITGGSTSGTVMYCNNYANVTGRSRLGAICGDNAGYAGTHQYNFFRKTAKINANLSVVGAYCSTYSTASGKLSAAVTYNDKTYTYVRTVLNAIAGTEGKCYTPHFKRWKMSSGKPMLVF